MKKITLKSRTEGNRLIFDVDNLISWIDYPKSTAESFGKDNFEAIAENILYSHTLPLSIAGYQLKYKRPSFFQDLVHQGIKKDLPKIAEDLGRDTKEIVSLFEKRKVSIEDRKKRKLSFEGSNLDEEQAVLGMSLGKDSLLTMGLAGEIGLKLRMVYFNDADETNRTEFIHKSAIIKSMEKETGLRIEVLNEHIDNLLSKGGKVGDAFFNTNAMLAYSLQIVPLSAESGSRYIILGNEQNFNDSFTNKDGFEAYPSYDQTSEYTEETNKMFDVFGGGFRVLSLIEPVYNIAEYKVLNQRYPELLKYIMSCSGKEEGKWCYNCPMCAKTYLYSSAVGLAPEELGFKVDFFGKQFEGLYPLFSNPTRVYEKPKAVRDEQLFAFYLAFKNKCKGYLTDKFKEKFLDEAKEREDELHKKFFRVYDAFSIPPKIKIQLNSIFKEELSK